MFLRSNGSSDLRASSAAVLLLEKLAQGIRRKVSPNYFSAAYEKKKILQNQSV